MSRTILDLSFTDLVFVYGSLKRGGWNNWLLESSDFMWEDKTSGNFVLTDVGFPYAVPEEVFTEEYLEWFNPEFLPVFGEVWKLDSTRTLERLDLLEGHPHHYYRVPVENNGVYMWMYQQPEQEVLLKSNLCPIIDGAYQWK